MNRKNEIKRRLQSSAPTSSDSEIFMKEITRQIELLPSPESEIQNYLRRFHQTERLSMRIDAACGILVGGGVSAVMGYLLLSHYELLLSAIFSFLNLL